MKYFNLIILIIIITACELDNSTDPTIEPYELIKISEIILSVPEPSGLTFSAESQTLWTVSDDTGFVYEMSLDGEVISTIDFGGSDLEGIAIDEESQSLWIVEEGVRNLKQIDFSGNIISSFEQIIEGNDNSGLEGICLADNQFVILKEKNPGQIIFSDFAMTDLQIQDLDFATDFSGVVHWKEDKYWILSDADQTLNLWSESESLLYSFITNIDKAEGIAFDSSENVFYIVSDSQNKLYKFNLVINDKLFTKYYSD